MDYVANVEFVNQIMYRVENLNSWCTSSNVKGYDIDVV